MEVAHGVPVCVFVKLLSTFRWSDATALSMHVNLGTATALFSQRIQKPAEPSNITVEVEKWNIWNPQTKEWVATSFEFRDLAVSEHKLLGRSQMDSLKL